MLSLNKSIALVFDKKIVAIFVAYLLYAIAST